jgi:hypothetical protein
MQNFAFPIISKTDLGINTPNPLQGKESQRFQKGSWLLAPPIFFHPPNLYPAQIKQFNENEQSDMPDTFTCESIPELMAVSISASLQWMCKKMA